MSRMYKKRENGPRTLKPKIFAMRPNVKKKSKKVLTSSCQTLYYAVKSKAVLAMARFLNPVKTDSMKKATLIERVVGLSVAVAVLLLLGWSPARASVLYEDIFYWMPDGSTVIDPPVPPTGALVKIQETVWDNVQGRQIISDNLGFGTIHGGAMLGGPINLYGYSISNLGYGNGPFTGVGAGITGFNIVDMFGGPRTMWGPNAAASWWHVAPGNSGPGNFEWDIDANNNLNDGDGVGVPLGNTYNGYFIAVPAGTPHGIFGGSWVHTWSGGGALEEPAAVQADVVYGLISGPVPEPGTAVLVGLGLLLARFHFRRYRG